MRTVYGRLADPLGHSSAAGRFAASPASAYLREQNPVIRIDQDHDHRWVGEVVCLARHGGHLWAVGEVGYEVVEAVNVRVGGQTISVPHRLYWSASRIGSADDGLALDSVSLTASPASVDPRPVAFLEGRLDHRDAASRWRSKLDRAEYELLRRAAVARYERRKGDPIVIAELGDPQVSKLGRNGGWLDRHGERLYSFQSRHADGYDDERPPGKLRMRPCTILRVS